MSARRLASCVWTGNNVVEAAKQAGKDQREGGSLNGRLRFAGLDAAGTALMREHRNLLLPYLKNALRAVGTGLFDVPVVLSLLSCVEHVVGHRVAPAARGI